MLLERSHLRWAIVTGLVLSAAGGWYAVYAATEPGGPRGGSGPGLVFGIAGTACILFAAFLGLRKKRPHYRLGRVATWLKGHLWLGALSFPLICFHGGFSFGGPLTQALMWLFVFVFLTGIYGLALQQFLPRLMTKNVPQETVYEQIDHVREQLLEEALAIATGDPKRKGVATAKSAGAIQGLVVSGRTTIEVADEARVPLSRFVERHVRPYFRRDGARRANDLADLRLRAALFSELKSVVEPALHDDVEDLRALCRQREQLDIQRRLHNWLHGWLLVHVPCAWAMVFLTVVHAIMALSY